MRKADDKFMPVMENPVFRKPDGTEVSLANAGNRVVQRDHWFSSVEFHFIPLIPDKSVYCLIGTVKAFKFLCETVIDTPAGMSLLGRH